VCSSGADETPLSFCFSPWSFPVSGTPLRCDGAHLSPVCLQIGSPPPAAFLAVGLSCATGQVSLLRWGFCAGRSEVAGVFRVCGARVGLA
jgi:hypothetical protein